MEPQKTYCSFVADKPADNLHKIYHDTEYGFPILNDNELFGRLLLEINQAGLSWNTILIKKENFRAAYSNFEIEKVANYSEKDRNRLLSDQGIIRNKLKVNAAIYNAQAIITLQKEHGSFRKWLDEMHPLTKEEWVKLFKKTFTFTGGEITNEFLMSAGYLPGAHDKGCPIYDKVLAENPKWNEK
ncbi:MAG: DNA-3-methyladenine glycosylase I [Crocinitomicaceae bacterium]